MEGTKLVYFLRQLSPQEFKNFIAYVESPFFNTRETPKKLLEVLEGFILKGMPDSKIPKKEVYKMVYEGNPFNAATLKTSMTQLLRLLQNYLAQSEFEKDKTAHNRYFLKKLNEIGEEKYFEKYYHQSNTDLEGENISSSDAYFEKVRLEEEFRAYADRKLGFDPSKVFVEAPEWLSLGFLIRMMRYYLRVLNLLPSYKNVKFSVFFELSLEYVKNHLEELPAILKAYYLVSCTITHPENEENFNAMKSLLNSYSDQFSTAENDDLYSSVLNFATRKVNEGDESYIPKAFDLYLEMLQKGMITEGDVISPRNFKNIVVLGSRLGKYDWTTAFIQDWRARIHSDYQENAIHFNMATLYYYQRKWKASQKLFNQVLDDYKDVFYGLNARGYLLQIYYETGNSRGMESLTHSFRMFLSRNKEISKERCNQYLAFIQHLNRLIAIPLQDKAKLKALKKQILSKKHKGMGSHWLLENIDFLLQSAILQEKED